MVKVRKRDGRIEEFMKSKIINGCEKAGATAKEAAKVAEEVAVEVTRFTIVTTDEIAKFVADSLEKINKKAADAYKNFREEKSSK